MYQQIVLSKYAIVHKLSTFKINKDNIFYSNNNYELRSNMNID